jgi:hypothetical protein
MNVKRSELLKALKQCLPGIENGNSVLEGADLFVFSKGFVYSYNDVISVAVPVKSEGLLEEDIEGAVRAEEFYSIISKFNGDLIEFIVTDNTWILRSGKAKAELTLMAGDFLERFENIAPDKKKWLEISPEFTQGLGICRMLNNKNAISGLYITSSDITSTDGFQINHYKYKGAEFENFWISDASAGELLKVGVLTDMQLKGTWVHFKTVDNTIFSVKTLQAEKWPYEKIIAVLDAHKKTKNLIAATLPKELFDAIDRASSFYFDISDSKAVRLSISPKRILVSAERVTGKYEERVAWKKECPQFPTFELYVDTNMILFVARRSMSFYIHEAEGGALRMIFTTENSVHLMTTLSIDDAEKTEPEKTRDEPAKSKNDKNKKGKVTPATMYDEEEDNEGKESERLVRNAEKKGTKDTNNSISKKSVKSPSPDDNDDEEDKTENEDDDESKDDDGGDEDD